MVDLAKSVVGSCQPDRFNHPTLPCAFNLNPLILSAEIMTMHCLPSTPTMSLAAIAMASKILIYGPSRSSSESGDFGLHCEDGRLEATRLSGRRLVIAMPSVLTRDLGCWEPAQIGM